MVSSEFKTALQILIKNSLERYKKEMKKKTRGGG